MDGYPYAPPPSDFSHPIAPWYPMEEYSVDAVHVAEDHWDHPNSAPTQPFLSPTTDMSYPSFRIDAERGPEYNPFPQDLPSFPHPNGFPAGDPPTIEPVNSARQSEVEAVASEVHDTDSESEQPPRDHPLPADAARWISMSPAQFDREYPGGNPFVIEELNSDSEEDLESASYIELGAGALKRIFIIFYAAGRGIFPSYHITDMHREIIWGVLVDLLKDGKIWLWADGDEEKCADLHWNQFWKKELKETFEYVKRKLSCSCLRLRKPSWSMAWPERVSKASFAMRVSAITWATFTSVCVREAAWARGRADWTRCALGKAAWNWYYDVLWMLNVVDLLKDEDWHSSNHFEVAFEDTLQCHGHSCYSSPAMYHNKPPLGWLYLQSFLHSTPLGNVSMIVFDDSSLSCRQCLKLKELYMANNDAQPMIHIPPLSLLAFNDLRLRLDIDMAGWLSILALGTSPGLISLDILTRMDDKIRMLFGTEEFEFEYQPWVNRLPLSLRGSVGTCSESEWREAEHTVRWENQHESVPTSRWDSRDIRLGVWITAMYLLLLEHSDSQKLTPLTYWIAFCNHRKWCDALSEESVYPPHLAASVEAFCAVSPHTCCGFRWDRPHCCGVRRDLRPLKLQQCYAAAYLLLHPESQDVPLLEPLQRPTHCPLWNRPREDCGQCSDCAECRRLPEAEPVVPLVPVVEIPEFNVTTPPIEERDDIVPIFATVLDNPRVSAVPQIASKSGRTREPALSKDVILPRLKDHFAKLLAQYDIPIQYTNLGVPQLPWCTLPQLLRNRRLEIAGWPQDLPLPDATGKHNAKGIKGLTAKDARRLYEVLPSISFRPMEKASARLREEESGDDLIGNRPTKKAKGKGKVLEQGEKKFRLSEVQTVVRGIYVEKSK